MGESVQSVVRKTGGGSLGWVKLSNQIIEKGMGDRSKASRGALVEESDIWGN